MKCERKRREGSEKGGNFGWNILRKVRNGFWGSNGNIKQQLWTDLTTQKKWIPQSPEIYLSATKFCISVFENTSFEFPVFITQTQNCWVLSDGNIRWELSQTTKSVWVPYFFITELWVSSDITQNRPKPNRPLMFSIYQMIFLIKKNTMITIKLT